MHLLCTIDTGGFDAWKAGFEDRTEAQGQAGLTLLQMWRDADDGDRAVVLFESHDRSGADAWMTTETALHAPVTGRFVETA